MKKKTFFITLTILFSLIVLLILAGSIWINYFWGEKERKLFLEKKLSSIIHRPVTIQKAEFQLFPRTSLILNQVIIKAPDGKADFISLKKLQLSLSLTYLFSRTIYFNYILLDHPRVFLCRNGKEGLNTTTQDLWNFFSFPVLRESKKGGWLKEVKISLKQLAVQEGEIDFKDWTFPQPPVEFYITNLTLRTGKPSKNGFIPIFSQFNFKNGSQLSHFNITGAILPIFQGSKIKSALFKGNTKFSHLSLSPFTPYLYQWKRITSLQGIGNGIFFTEGVIGKKFSANGELDIANFNFSFPQPHPGHIKINKLHLQFALNQEKEKWEFPLLTLTTPEFSMTGNFRVEKIRNGVSLINGEVRVPQLDYRSVITKFPLSLLPEKIQKFMRNINTGLIQNLRLSYSESFLPALPKPKEKSIAGNFFFRDISFKLGEDIPKFAQLSGRLNFKNRELTISDLTGLFGSSKINKSNFALTESGNFTLSGDFEIDLKEINPLLHLKQIPASALKELNQLQLNRGKGLLTIKGNGTISNLKNLALEGELKLIDADFNYAKFRQPARKMNGTIKFSSHSITFPNFSGLWANSPCTGRGEIKNYRSREEAKIYFHVESDEGDINDLAASFFPWEGVSGAGKVKIFIDFNCQGYRSENLRFQGESQFKGITLNFPAFPYPFEQTEGKIGFSSSGLTFPQIKFQTGSSEVWFSGVWDGLRNPKITGKLEGSYINFLDFYKPRPQKERKPPTFALKKVFLKIKEAHYKKLLVSNLETEISSQGEIFYFFSSRAAHGKLEDFSFSQLTTEEGDQVKPISYQQGIIRIPFLTLQSNGGYWIGKNINLPVFVEQPEIFTLTSEIKNLPTQEFLKLFPKSARKITGTLNLKGSVTGRGRNLSEWMKTLNGEMSFTSEKGVLKKLTIISKLFSLLNLSRIFTQDYSKLLSRGMAYDILTSEVKINNGIARTESIFLSSPAMKMNGVGEINLGEKTIDMEVAVQPLETVDKIVGKIPLLGTVFKGEEGAVVVTYYKVTGPLQDPEWKPAVFGSLSRKAQSIFKQIFRLPENLLNWNNKHNQGKEQKNNHLQ